MVPFIFSLFFLVRMRCLRDVVLLAKFMNVWRDLARKVFSNWRDIHGLQSAQDYISTMPPRCLAGRWFAIFGVEAYVDDPGHELIEAPLKMALDKTYQGNLNFDFDAHFVLFV